MQCYVCKGKTGKPIRTFVAKRTKRERDGFHDVCFRCYVEICMREKRTVRLEGLTAEQRAHIERVGAGSNFGLTGEAQE